MDLSRLGLGLMAFVIVGLAACASPEAMRMRAGGLGADIGNKTATVRLHEGSDPYFNTERLIGSYGQTDLEPARQAHRISSQ